jgi:zinc finger protein 830
MADVRALLKAKRQEVRINHPYAAYGANGALRCSACGVAIKFASAWEGHLGSKAHRVAVANLRAKEEEEEARRASAAAGAVPVSASKRKAEEGEGEEEQVEMGTVTTGKKRQRTVERDLEPDARSTDADGALAGPGASSHLAFPANFFSDPGRAPLRKDDDDDDEMDQDQDQDPKAKAGAPAPPPKTQFDMEWDAFERDMQQQSSSLPTAGGNESAVADPQEAYARATIAAEPELVVSRFEEGLPVVDGGVAQEGTTTTTTTTTFDDDDDDDEGGWDRGGRRTEGV